MRFLRYVTKFVYVRIDSGFFYQKVGCVADDQFHLVYNFIQSLFRSNGLFRRGAAEQVEQTAPIFGTENQL